MKQELNLLIIEDRVEDAQLVVFELRRAGYKVTWQRVESEPEFLAALNPSLDLIIADYHLPQFDGLYALELLRRTELDIPFIIVSGSIGEELAVFALKRGAADYLLKDRLTRLGSAVESALQQHRLKREKHNAELALRRAHSELEAAYEATLEGWSKALELRDKETEGHTMRVTQMTVHLARVLGVDEYEIVHIRRGALLHDIGKLGIPDGILLKPGPLTPEEWVIMRRHPIYAYEMLLPISYLAPALAIPRYHHEKWDGSGYPYGLAGEAIPLPARIFAVVDVWDALSFDRPYRDAWPGEHVRAYLAEQRGIHFDPWVSQVFLELLAAQGQA